MSIGAQLRASREARGLSIDAVAHATRVQPRILAAIERDDVAAVPPRPFGRGFVRSYAQEIGLDPDKVTRDYFAQFAPPPPVLDAPEEPPKDTSRGVTPLAIATFGIAAGLAIALFLGRSWVARPPSPAGQAIGTSGSTQAATPPTDTAVAAPAAAVALPVPVAAPAPSARLSIVLTASRKSWVTANADGRRALFQIVLPGSPQTVSATREIKLRVGDAGALQWVINGRSAGAMGRSGQVRDIRVTPDTAARIQ